MRPALPYCPLFYLSVTFPTAFWFLPALPIRPQRLRYYARVYPTQPLPPVPSSLVDTSIACRLPAYYCRCRNTPSSPARQGWFARGAVVPCGDMVVFSNIYLRAVNIGERRGSARAHTSSTLLTAYHFLPRFAAGTFQRPYLPREWATRGDKFMWTVRVG